MEATLCTVSLCLDVERAKAGSSRAANNLEIWRPGTDS